MCEQQQKPFLVEGYRGVNKVSSIQMGKENGDAL